MAAVIAAVCGVAAVFPSTGVAAEPFDRPNILWLTFEDTSDYELGCYGNPHTRTPTIDALAARGVRLTQARATAPHCSPARASIISGCYAPTYGTDWHRRNWPVPDRQYYFPRLLREAGYFTTNNAKTDYNAAGFSRVVDQIWSEQGRDASYHSPEREPGQPFFAVFNSSITHMGRIRSFHIEGRRGFGHLAPDELVLPGYVPDLPEIRSDYAFHMEGVEDLDRWVRQFLDDLEASGLEDDTIIFLYSDHGGCLPRAKGYPFDTGFRVPMIVYVPPRWRDRAGLTMGEASDRLVGFEDLAPTVLTLAGLDVPDTMQGRDFLSPGAQPKRYQFTFRTNHGRHFDPVRVVTDGRYQYIRFYMPHKPLGLRQSYQWGCPGYQAWDRLYHFHREACPPQFARWFEPTPSEYLFDLKADRWEMNNLAGDPAHARTVARMRAALAEHLRQSQDLGLFPTSTRQHGPTPLYEWVRQSGYPLESLYCAAELASRAEAADVERLVANLTSARPEIRFWGASGLATLACRGLLETPPPSLIAAVEDENGEVAAAAAEALCHLGRADAGLPVLIRLLRGGSGPAGSSLQSISESARPFADPLRDASHDFSARCVLINLGLMEYDRLYGDVHEEGVEVNRNRRDFTRPAPRPRGG